LNLALVDHSQVRGGAGGASSGFEHVERFGCAHAEFPGDEPHQLPAVLADVRQRRGYRRVLGTETFRSKPEHCGRSEWRRDPHRPQRWPRRVGGRRCETRGHTNRLQTLEVARGARKRLIRRIRRNDSAYLRRAWGWTKRSTCAKARRLRINFVEQGGSAWHKF